MRRSPVFNHRVVSADRSSYFAQECKLDFVANSIYPLLKYKMPAITRSLRAHADNNESPRVSAAILPVQSAPRRPLTQRRQRKIKDFIEDYIRDPEKFEDCGSDAWFEGLVQAVDEPGIVLLENVRHWVKINSDVFFITPEKYQKIFSNEAKAARKTRSGIRKKEQRSSTQKTELRKRSGESYFNNICKKLKSDSSICSCSSVNPTLLVNSSNDANSNSEDSFHVTNNSNSKPEDSINTASYCNSKVEEPVDISSNSNSQLEDSVNIVNDFKPEEATSISIYKPEDSLTSKLPESPTHSEFSDSVILLNSPVSLVEELTSSSSGCMIDKSSDELTTSFDGHSFVTNDEAIILQENLEKFNLLLSKMDEVSLTFEMWRKSLIILHEPCRLEVIQRFNDLRTKFDQMETEHIRSILNSADSVDSGHCSAVNSDEIISINLD